MPKVSNVIVVGLLSKQVTNINSGISAKKYVPSFLNAFPECNIIQVFRFSRRGSFMKIWADVASKPDILLHMFIRCDLML